MGCVASKVQAGSEASTAGLDPAGAASHAQEGPAKSAPAATPGKGTEQAPSQRPPWPAPPHGWQSEYKRRRAAFETATEAQGASSSGDAARAWQGAALHGCDVNQLEKAFPSHALKGLRSPWLPAPANAYPLFAAFAEKHADVDPLFAVADLGILGLANAQTPFPEDYPTEGAGLASASGSIFHLLVVPTSRVYNAVSLEATVGTGGGARMPSGQFLSAMRAETQRFLDANLASVIQRSRAEGLAKAEKLYAKEAAEERGMRVEAFSKRFDALWAAFEASGEPLEVGYFFHIHDDHSIGHLHMHAFPLNAALRTNRAHDAKCMPLDELLPMLPKA